MLKQTVLARLNTPGKAIRSYVPFVVAARGIAFVRTLLVAQMFGVAGKAEYGVYQPALELMNWIVPLVMFGLSDVIERYASRLEGEGTLRATVRRHVIRLVRLGIFATALLVMLSALVVRNYFHVEAGSETIADFTTFSERMVFFSEVGGTILLLALYQYAAAFLRGLRAYRATAAMEVVSALLFLVFAIVATRERTASALILAYASSLACVLAPAAWILWQHVRRDSVIEHAAVPAIAGIGHNRFAMWALVRLLLMMTFGLVSIWGVGHLAIIQGNRTATAQMTADYSMPYRVAQLLSYVAITLWSSVYGISSAAFTRGQGHRARRLYLRVGVLGAAATAFGALCLTLGSPVLARLLPAYASPLRDLLPAMSLLFFWYGLLAFASTWCDLHEAPQRGAFLWVVAVGVQVLFVMVPTSFSPAHQAAAAATTGLGVALFLTCPFLLRPFRLDERTRMVGVLAFVTALLLLPGNTGLGISTIVIGAFIFFAVMGEQKRVVRTR